MPFLLGKVRERIFGFSPERMPFTLHSFREWRGGARQRLKRVGFTLLKVCHATTSESEAEVRAWADRACMGREGSRLVPRPLPYSLADPGCTARVTEEMLHVTELVRRGWLPAKHVCVSL
jgi:hypothetical protein